METKNALTQLRPAEILVLVEGSKMGLASLMQATYLDLVARGVLSVEVRRKGDTELRYVGLGPNAKTTQLRRYEVGFVKMFEKNTSVSHFLHNKYITLVRKYSSGAQGFRTDLLSSPALSGLLKRSFFDLLKGTWQLSAAGIQQRDQLRTQLALAEEPLLEKRTPSSALLLPLGTAVSVLMVQSSTFRNSWFQREPTSTALNADGTGGADAWVVHQHDFDDGAVGCGGSSGCWGGDSGCHSQPSDSSGCGGAGCGDSGCGGSGCGGSGCGS